MLTDFVRMEQNDGLFYLFLARAFVAAFNPATPPDFTFQSNCCTSRPACHFVPHRRQHSLRTLPGPHKYSEEKRWPTEAASESANRAVGSNHNSRKWNPTRKQKACFDRLPLEICGKIYKTVFFSTRLASGNKDCGVKSWTNIKRAQQPGAASNLPPSQGGDRGFLHRTGPLLL